MTRMPALRFLAAYFVWRIGQLDDAGRRAHGAAFEPPL